MSRLKSVLHQTAPREGLLIYLLSQVHRLLLKHSVLNFNNLNSNGLKFEKENKNKKETAGKLKESDENRELMEVPGVYLLFCIAFFNSKSLFA